MVMFAMFISSVHYTRKALNEQLFPSDYLVSYTMFLELRYVGR